MQHDWISWGNYSAFGHSLNRKNDGSVEYSMYRYQLPGIALDSPKELPSFAAFATQEIGRTPTIILSEAEDLLEDRKALFAAHHKEMNISVLEEGWQFSLPQLPQIALRLTKDRSQILSTPWDANWKTSAMLPLLRTALECASAPSGVISLHAACVEKDGEAICFSAPSGVGKSTRAMQWIETLGATFVSGDRPSICLDGDGVLACGAPWDGKEGIYRNVQVPLKMICSIVRDDTVSVRRLSRSQARQFLLQQAFLPMWDTDATVAVMAVLHRLYDRVPVVELRCGPDAEAARAAYEWIYHHPERILEEAEQ